MAPDPTQSPNANSPRVPAGDMGAQGSQNHKDLSEKGHGKDLDDSSKDSAIITADAEVEDELQLLRDRQAAGEVFAPEDEHRADKAVVASFQA